MKRILLLLQLMIIAITLIGCTSSSGHEDLSVASDKKSQLITTNIDWFEQTASPIVVGNRLCDVLGFPDQSVPPKYEWVNLSETDDVETEYDNIDIALDYKTYRSNSIIRIHISNKNNKPYGFYPVPYVEKYDYNTNTWERLIYAPDEAYYAVGWYTGVGDVTLYFNPFYMAQPIEIGEYRFIVFVGEKEFYSQSFTIVKQQERK